MNQPVYKRFFVFCLYIIFLCLIFWILYQFVSLEFATACTAFITGAIWAFKDIIGEEKEEP